MTVAGGVQRVVRLLADNGFSPLEAGDGSSRLFDDDAPRGYVIVRLACGPTEFIDRIHDLDALLRRQVKREAYERLHVNGSYEPIDRQMLVYVSPITDGDLQ